MSSRDIILKSIKDYAPSKSSELPNINISHASYENINEKFSTSLSSVGGIAVFMENIEEIKEYIAEHYADSKVIVSNCENLLPIVTKDANATKDPHALHDVDLAIIEGEFGVAENGAVWIMEPKNRHRALYFIAQKLIIIIPKNEIVPTMHEAYEKLSFGTQNFGLFISGPSKTADIEQSLIIGAHGAIETCVIFI
ncbi:MAG: LUD domain-containing protein [Sulfurospirillaceae bacterium]|nr:LUD domain-containing protein [Sulfurospirillaceae bacterium]